MCGLVAVFSPGKPVSEDALQRAVQALHHRGPDGQGLWVSGDRQAALGHTRLSVIDLATGEQPIASEDETLHAAVNGELYDFEPVRRRLIAHGHRFRTASDSEIALHLYEDRGPSCLSELRGEFTLALWDSRQRLLFAARDRFGIKPLYYAQAGGAVYLASEAKALFAAGLPAAWDPEAVAQLVHLGVPLQDRSLFAGIRQVPPGHYLMAREQGLELHRYWDFDYAPGGRDPLAGSEDEMVERFRSTLDEAVRTRLRADVPVAFYLSGGVDSSAVLGLAAPHCRRPRAFTLRFQDAEYDESGLAASVAEGAGAERSEVPVSSRDLADHFAQAVWHSETACLNGHGVGKFLLSRAVREAGYKVVLTGEGADEILGGYAHFRRDLALHSPAGADPEAAEALRRWLQAAESHPRLAPPAEGCAETTQLLVGRLGFAPSWLEAQLSVAMRHRPLLAAPFAATFGPQDAVRSLLGGLDLEGQLRGRDPVHQSLYLYAKTNLPNYVLNVLGDRMEMAHSVEGRLPYLDHHLVELAARLPVRLKLRGLTEKYVLREAARPVLPERVYRRPKHPFLAPPALLEPGGPLHRRVEEWLRGEALAALPFYDGTRVRQLLDTLPGLPTRERLAFDPVLMTMASLCVLQERFRPAASASGTAPAG